MKKLSTVKSDKIIVLYVVKSVAATLACILLFTYLFSKIAYHFNFGSEVYPILTIIICALSAAVIAFSAVSGLKNNGVMLGILAQLPLLFYSIINMVFYDNSIVFFIIKTILVIAVGALVGLVTTKRKERFKIK